jgi:hypothetical protein
MNGIRKINYSVSPHFKLGEKICYKITFELI